MKRTESKPRHLKIVAFAAALTCVLAGCSTFEEGKIDYKSASQATTLEVPPDLTQLKRDSRYLVPASASALAMAASTGSRATTDAGTASNQVADVKIVRTGTQRYLLVQRSADAVWEPLRDFWKDNKFTLTTDQPELGIMETDWAENRAKLPQDFVRKTIGRIFDTLYSTGERDRFRTRVERTDNGIEITITHRGMLEVFSNAAQTQTMWTPRAADPELEIEFLRRLMLRLGGQNTATATNTAGKPAAANLASGIASDVKVVKVNERPAIEISDGFDRAWRRVGVAIDRTGFTVEDRDRAQGYFFVRYAPPGTSGSEPGFFAKLFSSDKATPSLAKYRIVLTSKGDVSTVQIQAADGIPETSSNAEKIIKLLADEIK